MNYALDSNGEPLVLYRGEYGKHTESLFQTRHGSITFVNDLQIAGQYAIKPNVRRDTPHSPRVFRATLDIQKPIINQPGDRFIDGVQIAVAVGEVDARSILIRHADAIENTDNWGRLSANFADVRHFLREHPPRLNELYVEAYYVLDDASAVELFREAGYDGAIYSGSGLSRDSVEYRVFSPCQVHEGHWQYPGTLGEQRWRP